MASGEVSEPLYEGVGDDQSDFDYLDALHRAEAEAEADGGGNVVAQSLEEQRAVVRALEAAQQVLDADIAGEAGSRPGIREMCAQIARARHIQDDDPFWALVELVALLFERSSDRERKIIEAAVTVSRGRLLLDKRILDIVPLVTESSEEIRAACEMARQDMEATRDEIRAHRQETGEFIDGVAKAFEQFAIASKRVAAAGQESLLVRILERVLVPLIATVGGILAGRFLLH